MPVSSIALQSCALFQQAPAPVVQQIAAQMQLVLLKRREVLLTEGKNFGGLGVVLQGRIQAIDHTVDGREVALSSVEVGGTVGHVNLLAPRPTEMTWIAASASSVAVLAPGPARELLRSSWLSLHLASDMAQQVCEFLEWQKIQSLHPVSARICAWLLRDSALSGAVMIRTHADVAWRLNTTRESVTRVLQRLQAEGVIGRDADLWRVERRDRLAELAHGESRAE